MNLRRTTQILTLASSCLFAVPIKCNSIFAKSDPKANDGYVYVTESGSHIVKRVKAGTDTDNPDTMVQTMGADQFRRTVDQAHQVPKTPGAKGN